ncbi:MAG: hypothetical protein R2710_26905 [Acidimicrobiales bacterium]
MGSKNKKNKKKHASSNGGGETATTCEGAGSSSTPSFLGLLNAIAVAETEAECYLTGWAATTDDPDLAETLRFVAMREGEHGKAFAKRMLELGYEVRWPDSGRVDARMAMACSSMTDREKFSAFGIGNKPGGPDVFDAMFEDKNLDPVTGGLLGRYIAEERDSGRRLYAARKALRS